MGEVTGPGAAVWPADQVLCSNGCNVKSDFGTLKVIAVGSGNRVEITVTNSIVTLVLDVVVSVAESSILIDWVISIIIVLVTGQLHLDSAPFSRFAPSVGEVGDNIEVVTGLDLTFGSSTKVNITLTGECGQAIEHIGAAIGAADTIASNVTVVDIVGVVA